MQNRNKNWGYTLIEVLIVLFIISIVSTVAVLSLNHNKSKEIETCAREIQHIITLATEQALLQSAIFSVSFDQEAMRIKQYRYDAQQKKPAWLPLTDPLLGSYVYPQGLVLHLSVNVADAQLPLIIFSNGEMTPFTLSISRLGEQAAYMIKGEADGSIHIEHLP
jgi:general secretion pathway protein H